jgi:hypothetical protein
MMSQKSSSNGMGLRQVKSQKVKVKSFGLIRSSLLPFRFFLLP